MNKIINRVSQELNLDVRSVTNTIKLLDEGSTIPFIARYRKEMTHSLTEVEIENIKKSWQNILDLIKRKEYIIQIIQEQDALTPQLKLKIESCWDSQILEDLYLPFKKKKKTKASLAKERGLEGLAQLIMDQYEQNLHARAQRFLNSELATVEEALQGARDIIAEWISENSKTREYVRAVYVKSAILKSTVVKSKSEEAIKYQQYFDAQEALNKIPSHRLLAILRAHTESFLKINLLIDEDAVFEHLERVYIKDIHGESSSHIQEAIKDSCKRLIFPSLENECLKLAKTKADEEAVKVFAGNLRQLLLSPPLGSKAILAIDPGFRTGCKIAVLDKLGNLTEDTTIYPHPPVSKLLEAQEKLIELCHNNNIEALAIGNGTAGKETYQWLKSFVSKLNAELYFVNESGASIYSASEIAREEFPEKDITVRGAISIGRRLMDPLAELVKIDPKSIGVGQYQHDVNQTMLKENLDSTIQSCVNAVGINLNTASRHLLSHVSGLGDTLAQNIVDFRTQNGPFAERQELLKVPRMGPKSFEQCAGFLRIKKGKNWLDNTGVHPESYSIVKHFARDLKVPLENIVKDPGTLSQLNLKNYISNTIGMPTLKDIVKELEKPGLDPRGSAQAVQFSESINSIEDLKTGMLLPGVVNNLTKFGAFVDIGVKESGLVHVSQITNRFIKDPAEVLKLNQQVRVKVVDIDIERKRISLSIKQAEN